MHKFISTLFLLFAIFIAPGAHADLDSKQAVTQQLMELSGMEKQVGQMAGLASAGLTMYQGKLPAELYDILNRALIEAYDPSKIKQIVFTHIDQNLAAKDMRIALNWLRSGIGRKITALEEASSAPDALEKMNSYAKGLVSNPPSKSRINLIKRLDSATHSSEIGIKLMETSMLGLMGGLEAMQPKESQMGKEQLEQSMAAQRPELQKSFQELATSSFLYTYQSLSNAELKRYVSFLETSGKTYQTVASAALQKALISASDNLAKAIVGPLNEYMKQNPPSKNKSLE